MISARLGRFVVVSGIAALINFGSRIVFSLVVPYPMAIALAFCAGISSAFVLNRLFVFDPPAIPLREQMFWFLAVNLFALAQTMAISLLLEYWLFPSIGMHWHSEAIAHAIGIVFPIASSYLGHKKLSFRTSP
ncbi:MAG: GtrA family protein [Rhodanobacteraceae bacterium]|nr:GtrA family protein [Rhodanobacteraceae bacterium]